MAEYINREKARDALWKALYDYENKTEHQFIEHEELDVSEWFMHRIFVQNMNGLDRQAILNLPAEDVVERTYSAWELKTMDDGYGEYQLYVCNRCGACTARKRNFCPDCGAKMRTD